MWSFMASAGQLTVFTKDDVEEFRRNETRTAKKGDPITTTFQYHPTVRIQLVKTLLQCETALAAVPHHLVYLPRSPLPNRPQNTEATEDELWEQRSNGERLKIPIPNFKPAWGYLSRDIAGPNKISPPITAMAAQTVSIIQLVSRLQEHHFEAALPRINQELNRYTLCFCILYV